MNRYIIYTRGRGNFEVVAHTTRHAVAIVVAHLKLTVDEAECVVRWCVAPQRGPADGTAGSVIAEHIPCHVEV